MTLANRKGLRIDVLDHGYVMLKDFMGDDLRIATTARVLPTDDDRGEPDNKLRRYMIENFHTTPFEHVVFTFLVRAPVFVYRQWHRHRTWSYNEESARYKQLDDDFYFPDPDRIKKQSQSNHQGGEDEMDPELAQMFLDELVMLCRTNYEAYDRWLKAGVARETARMMLNFNIYSTMYATVNLHNLMKFLHLRMDGHAQWEIRQYANAIYKLIYPIVPNSMECWRAKNEARLEG